MYTVDKKCVKGLTTGVCSSYNLTIPYCSDNAFLSYSTHQLLIGQELQEENELGAIFKVFDQVLHLLASLERRGI